MLEAAEAGQGGRGALEQKVHAGWGGMAAQILGSGFGCPAPTSKAGLDCDTLLR